MATALWSSEATLASPASPAFIRASVISARRSPRLESAFWSPPSRCSAIGRSCEQDFLKCQKGGLGDFQFMIQINFPVYRKRKCYLNFKPRYSEQTLSDI